MRGPFFVSTFDKSEPRREARRLIGKAFTQNLLRPFLSLSLSVFPKQNAVEKP